MNHKLLDIGTQDTENIPATAGEPLQEAPSVVKRPPIPRVPPPVLHFPPPIPPVPEVPQLVPSILYMFENMQAGFQIDESIPAFLLKPVGVSRKK